MGRPKVYKAELHPIMAKSLYSIGLTDAEVAVEFGVAVSTVLKWANVYPEFKRVRKISRALPDARVVQTLFKKAVGYEYAETTLEPEHVPLAIDSKTGKIVRPKGKPKNARMVVTKIVKKQLPPDTIAMIFWMKNRMPEYWKDRHHLESDGKAIATLVVPTDDQIRMMIIEAQSSGGNGKDGSNGSHIIKDATGTG